MRISPRMELLYHKGKGDMRDKKKINFDIVPLSVHALRLLTGYGALVLRSIGAAAIARSMRRAQSRRVMVSGSRKRLR